MDKKLQLWNSFCSDYEVNSKGIPLFDCSGMNVSIFSYGKDKRIIIKRSKEMDELVISEVNKVIKDYKSLADEYEGLIYMMFWRKSGEVVPLYIGKTEKYGKKGGNLSQNLLNLKTNFARWGNNYAYHLGDLSAVVCEGHSEGKKTSKYRRWAETLFISYPTATPILKQPTYFWIHAWKKGDIGPWKDFGATTLTFLEYLLIGLAITIYPDNLLNAEGVNRK